MPYIPLWVEPSGLKNRGLGTILVFSLFTIAVSNFNIASLCFYSGSCKPLCVFIKGITNKRRLELLTVTIQYRMEYDCNTLHAQCT